LNLLIVGGAGYVGSIVRPALERHHTCRYLDLQPVPDAEERCVVGNVNDDAALQRAIPGVEGVVWIALGTNKNAKPKESDLDMAFDVNVRGFYRLLSTASEAGVRHFVNTSSLSVHERVVPPVDESVPPNAWKPYGMTKRLGEFLGEALVHRQPDTTFISLRLMWPWSDEDWPGHEYLTASHSHPIGPNDLRRLFLAAIAFRRPGAYVLQATGDLEGRDTPNTLATKTLGWRPEGR